MKPQTTLSTKILALAFLNLALLAAVFLAFVRVEFRLELGSVLLAPALDRILAVSRLLALEIPETDPSDLDALLARYAKTNQVEFHLYDSDANRLAGPVVELPEEIQNRVRSRRSRYWGPPPPGEAGQTPEQPPNAEERRNGPPGGFGPPLFLISTSEPNRYWIGVRIPVRIRGETGRPLRGTLLLESPTLLGNLFFFDWRPWLIVITAVIGVSILCWLPLIRGLTRSISQMTRATEQIAEGRFEVHVSEGRRDELGQLGTAINRMATRLSGFVTGQKRFLGDIAHELSSPIARTQFALGNLEQRADESMREFVVDLQEEVQHMSGLVSELLSFSKAGMQKKEVALGPVDISATVERVLSREAPPGSAIRTDIEPNLTVLAEPEHLFRAIANLVRNAVRYAGDAGPITVSARREGESVVVRVTDSGPGLPEEALEEVFTPFYRPEPSRRRDTGGVGLGLAIVKTCVEACKGTVLCRNLRPTGLEVEIRLQPA